MENEKLFQSSREAIDAEINKLIKKGLEFAQLGMNQDLCIIQTVRLLFTA